MRAGYRGAGRVNGWIDASARAVVAALMANFAFLVGARAEGPDLLSLSYITPFPETDRYKAVVIGDWLAGGLARGLRDAFEQDASLQIAESAQPGFGLSRGDPATRYYDIDKTLAAGPAHIAVVMLGANDLQGIRTQAGRLLPTSTAWKDAYTQDAAKLIAKLKAVNAAVYWVGLPPMGNPSLNDAVSAVNDAVRQTAYSNGAKYIDTWAGFIDRSGVYSAYGPDLSGQNKRLRDGDGIGFTEAGNRKLASYVETVLRRDLAQAKNQRNIPLAGDEQEQALISGAREQGSPEGQTTVLSPPKQDTGAGVSLERDDGTMVKAATQTSSLPEVVAANIGGEQGETVLSDLAIGLTAIAVISPVSDLSIRDLQRQTPLGERVYYRVLNRGETLPSKEGRADDFTWLPSAGDKR